MAFLITEFAGTQWTVLDGDCYVSISDGDDMNDGSPANPVATIGRADILTGNGLKVVIGSGVYTESVYDRLHFEGDGDVRFIGDGTQDFIAYHVKNIHFENMYRVYNWPGVVDLYEDCYLKDCFGIGATLKNCTIYGFFSTASCNSWLKCTFINYRQSANSALGTIKDCYFDETCVLRPISAYLIDWAYNNFHPSCTINGMTPTTWMASEPLYNQFSFSLDGQILNYTKESFRYADTSPNLFAGSDGFHIGATDAEGVFVDGFSAEIVGGLLDNINIDANGNMSASTPSSNAKITTLPIDLGSKKPIYDINFHGVFNYPLEVFDYDNGDTLPNHLKYRMKYGDTSGAATDDLFKEFVYGIPPFVDDMGRGNGNVAYDSTAGEQVDTRWVILEITLRNDGV